MKESEASGLGGLTSAGQEIRAGFLVEVFLVKFKRSHHCHSVISTLVWIAEAFSWRDRVITLNVKNSLNVNFLYSVIFFLKFNYKNFAFNPKFSFG